MVRTWSNRLRFVEHSVVVIDSHGVLSPEHVFSHVQARFNSQVKILISLIARLQIRSDLFELQDKNLIVELLRYMPYRSV